MIEIYDSENTLRLLGSLNIKEDISVLDDSYILTHASLEELLNCPYFLLPNETPDTAANRRYLG